MATEKKDQSTLDLAQLVVTQSKTSGDQHPAMEQLVSLLAKKLGREIQEQEDAEKQLAAARKANADNMVELAKQEEARQNGCSHVKPGTTRSALAGQKTGRGWLALVCQYCGKTFSHPPQRPGEDIPPHLYPEGHMIGGPLQ